MRISGAAITSAVLFSILQLVTSGLYGQEDTAPKIKEQINVQLRWAFKEGRKISVRMEQDMDVVMNIMGRKVTMLNDSSTYMTWLVDSIDDAGIATVKTTIDRAIIKIENSMTGKTSFDSASDEELSDSAKPLAAAYKPLLGVETITTMKTTGEVVDVKISEKALEGIQQASADGIIDKEMFEKLTRDASPSFPETVSSGDTWKRESEMKLPIGKLVLATTYKYEGTEMVDAKELHRIGMEIEMKFALGPEAGGVSVDIIEQKNSGFIHFDNKGGRIVATQMNQDMTMEVDSGNGQIITQNLEQRVTTIFTDGD